MSLQTDKDNARVQATLAEKIRLNTSQAFINKTNTTGNNAAFSHSFHQQIISVESLLGHIGAGKAYTLGAFVTNKRAADYWHSSQLLGLDFDHATLDAAELAANPFIARYGLVVYPTPSSTPGKPKSRVLFLLEKPLDDLPAWQAIQLGLLKHFRHLMPDAACKDAARLFFGSTQPGHIVLGQIMPLSVAYDLITNTPPPAAPPVSGVQSPKTRLEAYANAGHKCNIDSISAATLGQRNMTLYRAAVRSLSLAAAGWINTSQVERDLMAAAAYVDLPEKEARATIESAAKNAAPAAEPRHKSSYLTLDQRRAAKNDNQDAPPAAKEMTRYTLLDLEKFKPDEKLNAAYLPAKLPDGDLLIKSDMGTGKTTRIAEMTAGKRVLIVTHRRALCAALATPFNAENYEGLEAADVRRVSRLTITYDSLPKLINKDAAAPTYDYVILDEVEQGLKHLGGGTLKDSAASVYLTLKQVIASAGRVIAMDAHAAQTSAAWLKSLRPNVTALENTYKRHRAPLTVYDRKASAIDAITAAADENAGAVVVACSSKEEVKRLERYYSERYSPDDVFSIHGDNSHEKDRQAFIRNINQQLPLYRVVIYSPSVGSGVDIQAPVRLSAGLFDNEPLNAAEAHQMLNRCRNARATVVYVQRVEGTRETSAAAIYETHMQNAIATGKIAGFNLEGVPVATDAHKALNRLLSMLDAYTNASKNNLYDHFLSLATGYESISFNDRKSKQTDEQLKAIGETIKQEVKAAVLVAPPVSYAEYDAAQQSGELTMIARYGHARYKIEQAAGRDIDPELYDILNPDAARAALYLLSDVLHARIDELKAFDIHQSERILSKRRHATRKAILLRQMLYNVFGNDWHNFKGEFTSDEITSRVQMFIDANGLEFRRLFGHRADQSMRAVPLIRFALSKIGLKLTSRQAMHEGRRFMVYCVDDETRALMLGLAASCRARAEADAAERLARIGAIQGVITKNVDDKNKQPHGFSRARLSAASIAPKMPAHIANIDLKAAAAIQF